MLTKTILLAALLLVGCSAPVEVSPTSVEHDRTLQFALDGSDVELALARAAAEIWNATCEGNFVAVRPSSERVDGDVPMYGQLGLIAGHEIGVTCWRKSGPKIDVKYVVFQRDLDPSYDLKFVLAHELGHALGLPHVEAGLMKPYYDGSWVAPSGGLVPGSISPEQCAEVEKIAAAR